jgi:hypothetical protein
MRYLLAALLVAACAPEAPAPGYTTVADASVAMCPLVGTEGVSGAYWFSSEVVAGDGCVYRCAPDYRICGDSVVAGIVQPGECRAYNDPRNCGRCGDVCRTDEVCTTLPASNGEFLCIPRGR